MNIIRLELNKIIKELDEFSLVVKFFLDRVLYKLT